MPAKVTIRDISARVGVSPATVSNVLNGRRERVSEATARSVLKAAEEMGYRIDPVSVAAVVRRTNTIGIIAASINSPLFARAVSGAQALAARFGYSVILCNNAGTEDAEIASTDLLLDQGVDGVIFVSSSSYSRLDALERVIHANVPFVVVNRLTDSGRGLHVLCDNEQGGYEATEHLIELGHRRIGCIHLPVDGPTATQAGMDRLRGYRRALSDYGLEEEASWVRPGVLGRDAGTAVGYRVMQAMLGSTPRPSAVVCGSDELAIGAMYAAIDMGLSVPGDLAVVGFDDTASARHVRPSLSSVAQPMNDAGARAAEALIQHLWQGVALRGVERLPCRLVARASSLGQTGT